MGYLNLQSDNIIGGMKMDNKIYEKLANVQMNLLKRPLKKSGYNKFGHFNYFELKDILAPIIEECFKQGLVLTFSFMDDYAILKIRDTSNAELLESNRVAVPELREMNKGMNIMQSYGSYMTYLKRYLLLNTFLLDEDSFIDSDSSSQKNEGYLHDTPEKQRVVKKPVKKSVDEVKLEKPEDYLKFFENDLVKQGLNVNTITLYKMCTLYAKSHKSFNQKEVRELIKQKYGGKK